MSPAEHLKASDFLREEGTRWVREEGGKKGDTLGSSALALVTEIKVLLVLNLPMERFRVGTQCLPSLPASVPGLGIWSWGMHAGFP